MPTLWFCLIALLLCGYVVLDGFDIGAGIVHLFVAKDDRERRRVLASIGPVWDGNEVWLLAGGGTIYFAFPNLYASSFSGFYLALMVVLWLLVLRGISIEFRNHLGGELGGELWGQFWDVVFAGSSALLAIFYGAALGNVVRGVPLDADGTFFLPLWTNFQPAGPEPGIIDWYTVLVGLTAFAILALHGALWVAMKTDGAMQGRSRDFASRAWMATVLLAALTTAASFSVQPLLGASFAERPWLAVVPVLAAGGLAGVWYFLRQQRDREAFLSGACAIIGLLGSAAAGLYPTLLPSNVDHARSLTVANTATSAYGMSAGLFWFFPALALAFAYTAFVYRRGSGKVELDPAAHG